MRRKAPTEPSSHSASAFPLTILQDSCLVRPVVSEGCCAYPAPPRGVPRRPPCAGHPIMGRHRALPPFSSQKPRERPKVHRVPAVGTRKHSQEKTGKAAAETSTSLRISGSGLWEAALVLAPLLYNFRTLHLPCEAGFPSRQLAW